MIIEVYRAETQARGWDALSENLSSLYELTKRFKP
jgi:hypothetical protein